jgi:exopolysaccharide biosynthesis predicted pyruvyltransferase EpsI
VEHEHRATMEKIAKQIDTCELIFTSRLHARLIAQLSQ